jgi:hypothetical protein
MCRVCGTLIPESEPARALYCSRMCKGRATYRRSKGLPVCDQSSNGLTCPVCGGIVAAARGPRALYCSARCAGVGSNRRRRGLPLADPPVVRTCEVCGKEFPQTPHMRAMKYCSRNCAARATYRRRRGFPVANQTRVCSQRDGPVDPRKPITAVYCSKHCAQSAAAHRHATANHDHMRARVMQWRNAKRAQGISVYGGGCECCGERDPAVLTVDHIDASGAAHRRSMTQELWVWLEQENYPRDNIRLLCHNCNAGRAHNGGDCPHTGRRNDPQPPRCVFCGGELDTRMAACSACQREQLARTGTLFMANCVTCQTPLIKPPGRAGSGQRYFCPDCARQRKSERERWRTRQEREKAIAHYGGRCACGETELLFLTIHHLEGGGAAHRRSVGTGSAFYRWLRGEGYPAGFQVLCWNCNWKKGDASANVETILAAV